MTRQTLAEWSTFVNGLEPDALVENTENANSVGFVKALQQEGYAADEIHSVLVLFAKRWKKLGQRPPAGGYVDLAWLAENP